MHKTRVFLAVILLFLGSLYFPHLLHADESTDNGVGVTVGVPPRTDNFQFQLSSLDKQQTNLPPGTTQTYQITYGALQSASFTSTFTLVADFSDDKILGIDVVDFIPGSATNAYNAAQPVVDTINHTITWNFTLPPDTPDQTVSFQLRTNDHYTGTQAVPFKIVAEMKNEYDTFQPLAITQTYNYTGQLIATATPAPMPTSTTTPLPTPIPTPTPIEPRITDVSITQISQSTASVETQTSVPMTVSLAYGPAKNALTNVVSSTTLQNDTTLSLGNLSPSTAYYYKVTAATSAGKQFVSDLFTFKTAAISKPADVSQIVVTSNDRVLYAPAVVGSQTQTGTPQIILPHDTPYQLTVRVDNADYITAIHALLKSTQVLGLATPALADGIEYEVPVTQTDPGVYVVTLTTPKIKSTYEVLLRITDTKGNLIEKKIADLRSSSSLIVLQKSTHIPIEHARVLLFRLNEQTSTFEQIPLSADFANPMYTNPNGEISPILRKGTYKAAISALGYVDATVTFTLGIKNNQDFPTVFLVRKPFNVATTISYYTTTLADTLLATRQYVLGLSQSVRFFELNALIVTILFIFITAYTFSEKIHIPLLSFPAYFIHIGQIRFLQKQLKGNIHGKVIDKETQTPIAHAAIYLIDSKKRSILGHTTTNSDGNFSFATLTSTNYALSVLKEGFRPTIVDQSDIRAVGSEGYVLTIHQHLHGEAIHEEFGQFFRKIPALLFETTLIISFMFELAIGFTFGIEKALVFMCFSLVNVFLWILHLTHLHSLRHSF